jgi:hypothetical protein
MGYETETVAATTHGLVGVYITSGLLSDAERSQRRWIPETS